MALRFTNALVRTRLGIEEQAIEDLERAIDYSPSIRDLLAEERDLELLHGNERFEKLLQLSNNNE